MKTTQKDKLKAVTGMNEIPYISEGVAAESAGYVISEDGLTRLAESVESGEASAARVTELEGSLQTAQTAQATAETNLATANQTITANNTRIQELEAQVAELETEPAVTRTKKRTDLPETGKVKAHENPKSSFNQAADRFFPASRKKEETKDED